MLKQKFAKLESKAPYRAEAVDTDAMGDQVERLKQIGVTKDTDSRIRNAPSLSAALQPEPRMATKPAVKQDILHTARLAGRHRGIQNALVKVAETAAAPTILSDLAKESRSEIRMAVADNVYTPCEVKAALAQDKNPDIRFALAENHSTPMEVLVSLQDDENPYVAGRAKKTLERLKMKQPAKGDFENKSQIYRLRKQA